MGKLSAYLIGTVAILALSYYYLSLSFYPLIGWLEPYFGGALILVMGNLLFLLGNPLRNTFLIPVYIIVGILIGLGARKGRKAFVSTLTIYGSILSITGIASVSMILGNFSTIKTISTKLTTSQSLTNYSPGSFPIAPPTASLQQIFGEPLIGRLLSVFSSISTSGISTSNITGYISSIIPAITREFIIYGIVDFAIVLTFATLTGGLLGRLINGKKTKKSRPLEVKDGKNIVEVAIIALVILAIVFSSFSIPLHSSGVMSPVQKTSDYRLKSGNLFTSMSNLGYSLSNNTQLASCSIAGGFVSPSGNLYTVFGAYGNSTSPASKYSKLFPSGSLTFLEYSCNLTQLIDGISTFPINTGYNISQSLPLQIASYAEGGLIITLTVGNVTKTKNKVISSDTNFISTIGGANQNILMSINIPNGVLTQSSSNPMSLFIVGFLLNPSQFSTNMENSYPLLLGDHQNFDLYKNESLNHITNTGLKNANSYLFASAFLNNFPLVSAIAGSNFLGKSFSGQASFTLSVFEQSNVFTSSSSIHKIGLSRILDSNTTLSFNTDNPSLIISAIPEMISAKPTVVYHIYSSESRNLTYLNFGSNLNFTQVSGTIQTSKVDYISNNTFPANLSWNERTGLLGKNEHFINIQVKNTDNETLKNLKLNESLIQNLYPANVITLKGKDIITNASLPSGSTMDLNFTISTPNGGIYVVPPPILTYTNNNTAELSLGHEMKVSQLNKSLAFTFNSIVNYYISYSANGTIQQLNILNTPLFQGLYLFDLIIILILIADVVLEIKAISTWSKNRKNK